MIRLTKYSGAFIGLAILQTVPYEHKKIGAIALLTLVIFGFYSDIFKRSGSDAMRLGDLVDVGEVF